MKFWNGDTQIICEISGCHKRAIEIKFVNVDHFPLGKKVAQLELPVCNDHLDANITGTFQLEEVKK